MGTIRGSSVFIYKGKDDYFSYGTIPQSRQSTKLFSSRRNWDPLTHRLVCYPLLSFRGAGEVDTLFRETGWGSPIPTRGQTLWYSRYTVYVLCAQYLYFYFYSRWRHFTGMCFPYQWNAELTWCSFSMLDLIR
jgi:hypothetical protein